MNKFSGYGCRRMFRDTDAGECFVILMQAGARAPAFVKFEFQDHILFNLIKKKNFMHRNSQKRYYGEYIYFITTNTQQGFPRFKKKELCEIVMKHIETAKGVYSFLLYGFCINYDHIHILLQPNNIVANISKVMQGLKTRTSREINEYLDIDAGGSSSSRLREFPRFQRQSSYHDHIIRDTKDFVNHLHYTQYNYLKHGLPEDWKYSSDTQKKLLDYITQ